MEGDDSGSGVGLRRPKLMNSILRTPQSKDTDFKGGSRITPTLSTVLPVRESTALSTTSESPSYECLELNSLSYASSNFPSLFENLGLSSRRQRRHTSQVRLVSPRSVSVDSTDSYNFAEELRRRNETRWLRIQAVAKDTMERYERYSDEINHKNRRQRREIRRKNKEQLEKLRQEENKKREIQLYNSTHGRIWRHHRSLQRRALKVQEMNSQHEVGYYPIPSTVR